MTIRAGDEAGAYYGFLSLGQLIVADGSTYRVRAATIDDAPAFLRRGAILDPAPLTGVSTDASRADLLRRVKVGVGHKLDFVDLAGGTNGEFALLTSLFYTWNPTAYEPATAAAAVERILAG